MTDYAYYVEVYLKAQKIAHSVKTVGQAEVFYAWMSLAKKGLQEKVDISNDWYMFYELIIQVELAIQKKGGN